MYVEVQPAHGRNRAALANCGGIAGAATGTAKWNVVPTANRTAAAVSQQSTRLGHVMVQPRPREQLPLRVYVRGHALFASGMAALRPVRCEGRGDNPDSDGERDSELLPKAGASLRES